MDMIVYRVLRPDENPECLIAKSPFACYTVLEHVLKGHLSTQFISTCKSTAKVMDFADKGKPYAMKNVTTGLRKIVSINLTKLLQLVPCCEIIDLTLPDVLNSYIPIMPPYIPGSDDNIKARKFATKFQEVLIKLPVTDHIPAECVAVIDCV
jgi:hypothetical protein